MTDPIVDMFNRIRSGAAIGRESVLVPHSKIKESILKILKREGYINDYSVEKVAEKDQLKVMLKYEADRPLISGVRRVSKPGRRNYVGAGEIPRVMDGLGIAIISTPQGLMVGRRARKKKIGGEIICEVW